MKQRNETNVDRYNFTAVKYKNRSLGLLGPHLGSATADVLLRHKTTWSNSWIFLFAACKTGALSNEGKNVELNLGYHIIATVAMIAAVVAIDQKNNLRDRRDYVKTVLSVNQA